MRAWNAETPWALVDIERVERNTRAMAQRMADLGVQLRPHVKTHRCAELARLQVRGHFGGITVATLAEARYFARHGFRDITYAVPLAPQKIPAAADLARDLDRLHVLVDHADVVAALEAHARSRGPRFSVMLKVDCGYHRCGVDPQRPESLDLAIRIADSRVLDFTGILTHAGHAYRARSRDEIRVIARQERLVMAEFAARLRERGVDVPVVSVGSTPTMAVVEDLTGVTEVRPGNYVFFDRFQATIGSCSLDDVAFFVVATVIGHYPERRTLVLDAGALALSRDPGPVHVDPGGGYGLLYSEGGSEALPGLHLVSLSQEHGKVQVAPEVDMRRFPIGTRLRILPNHACLAAAGYDRYVIVRGTEVLDVWPTLRGDPGPAAP